MTFKRPWITPKADGPMLVMRDGGIHFLTWRERIQLVLGLTDAEKLDRKYRAASSTETK